MSHVTRAVWMKFQSVNPRAADSPPWFTSFPTPWPCSRARAGKRHDWGHGQFITPGSGMQTLSFPKGFWSKLGLARCHTLLVPMNFRGSTWQFAGFGSYHLKERLSICGTWIRRLRAAKPSWSQLLTSLIRSASTWLTLPNKNISIYGHWPSRNSI